MDTYISQKELHKYFGGLVYVEDFNTYEPQQYAERILMDQICFDKRNTSRSDLYDWLNKYVEQYGQEIF